MGDSFGLQWCGQWKRAPDLIHSTACLPKKITIFECDGVTLSIVDCSLMFQIYFTSGHCSLPRILPGPKLNQKKKCKKKDDAKLESSTPWARRRHNCTHSARIDFHFYFFSFRCLGSSRAAIFSVRFFHSRVCRTEHISPHVSHQCQPTCRVCMSLSMRSVHNLVVRKFSARHRLRIYS